MTLSKVSSVNEKWQLAIKEADTAFAAFARDVAKLSKAIKDAKSNKSPWPLKTLGDLVQATNGYSKHLPGPDLKTFAQVLHESLGNLRELFLVEFGKELRDQATAVGLDFHATDAGYVVGPFDVTPDLQKESCGLRYAKAPVVEAVPLNAKEVVAAVGQHSKSLLDVPRDIKSLSDDFESSVRVCIARKGPVKPGNLRAELPALLKELQFLRTGTYSRPQFVVELSTLVKSDANVEGTLGREFRLETAVIENSKNESKSVFVPDKLDQGSGEGKYYQAISVIYR